MLQSMSFEPHHSPVSTLGTWTPTRALISDHLPPFFSKNCSNLWKDVDKGHSFYKNTYFIWIKSLFFGEFGSKTAQRGVKVASLAPSYTEAVQSCVDPPPYTLAPSTPTQTQSLEVTFPPQSQINRNKPLCEALNRIESIQQHQKNNCHKNI